MRSRSNDLHFMFGFIFGFIEKSHKHKNKNYQEVFVKNCRFRKDQLLDTESVGTYHNPVIFFPLRKLIKNEWRTNVYI